MSIEQRTRVEIVKAISLCLEALQVLLNERVAEEVTGKVLDKLASGENPGIPETPVDTPVVAKAKRERAKKEANVPAPKNEEVAIPAPTMADIKPTKPGKTLADLRVALQECINKHGMPGAKERLAPFAKISDVPDAEIVNVIARLAA